MVYSYYPGCTLKNKAQDLDRYARLSAQALGITLEEIENWQCCGGVYPMAKDEIATKLSSVRALADAKAHGRDLITLCSACHNVLKQVNNDMLTDEDICTRANNYLKLDEEYHGETKVVHYLEMLRDVVGFDTLKSKVVNPLTGKKIGAYYGCLLLRPGKVLQMDDPENPMRNECCGGYVSIEDKAAAESRRNIVAASAAGFEAEMMITACPLCMYNLKKNDSNVPVYYFTELLAEALGVKD